MNEIINQRDSTIKEFREGVDNQKNESFQTQFLKEQILCLEKEVEELRAEEEKEKEYKEEI